MKRPDFDAEARALGPVTGAPVVAALARRMYAAGIREAAQMVRELDDPDEILAGALEDVAAALEKE